MALDMELHRATLDLCLKKIWPGLSEENVVLDIPSQGSGNKVMIVQVFFPDKVQPTVLQTLLNIDPTSRWLLKPDPKKPEQKWVVRFPSQYRLDVEKGRLEDDLALTKFVRQNVSVYVPADVYWDLSTNNQIGRPFIIQEFARGEALMHKWNQHLFTPMEWYFEAARVSGTMMKQLSKIKSEHPGKIGANETLQPVQYAMDEVGRPHKKNITRLAVGPPETPIILVRRRLGEWAEVEEAAARGEAPFISTTDADAEEEKSFETLAKEARERAELYRELIKAIADDAFGIDPSYYFHHGDYFTRNIMANVEVDDGMPAQTDLGPSQIQETYAQGLGNLMRRLVHGCRSCMSIGITRVGQSAKLLLPNFMRKGRKVKDEPQEIEHAPEGSGLQETEDEADWDDEPEHFDEQIEEDVGLGDEPEDLGKLEITGVIDWDRAEFAPGLVAFQPITWLWGTSRAPRTSEKDNCRLTRVRATSGAVPIDQQNLEIRQVFLDIVGQEWMDQACLPHADALRVVWAWAKDGFEKGDEVVAKDVIMILKGESAYAA